MPMLKKTKKILLIEDDPAIIDIYKTVLEKAHFDVEVISSGGDAIKRIKDLALKKGETLDLVLIDLVLPDISGMEVFREIKKDDITKTIKVFMLTNQQNDQLLQWPDAIRPDQYLIKANITTSQLVELIQKTI